MRVYEDSGTFFLEIKDKDNRGRTDKKRVAVGSDYKLNKRHSLSAFYRYVNTADEDGSNGHVIGVGYKFKL